MSELDTETHRHETPAVEEVSGYTEPGKAASCYGFLLVQLCFTVLLVMAVVLKRFDLPAKWLAGPLVVGFVVLLWWRARHR